MWIPVKNSNQAGFLTSCGKFIANRPDRECSAESARASTENAGEAFRKGIG